MVNDPGAGALTALEIARRIGRGESTATDVVGHALDAARADTCNAFTHIDEAALDRAEAIDASLASGAPARPLSGVPIAVKDLIDHEGRTTTAGSGFYRHRATGTAPALARMERAGAVVIGRTGLHEFAFGFSSENPWFGPVTNPWDADLSPGGSSGGSAAAVSSGVVPLALGTDTGGSVRVPAAMCSIAGLKVTHGRIPATGVFPLVPSLDTVGPLATSIGDLEVAAVLMSGAHAGDPHSREMEWSPTPPTSLADVRLVVPRRWVDTAPMSDTVARAFDLFLAQTREAGATIVDVEAADLVPSPHIMAVIGPEVAAIHRTWREEGRPYGDDVGTRVDDALAVSGEQAAAARRWRAEVTDRLDEITAGGAFLVTPSVPDLDKRIGVDRMGAHHHRTVLSWFSAVVNQTGAPALSLPLPGAGRTPSIQLVGRDAAEPALLNLGRALEDAWVVRTSRRSSC